MCLKIYESDPAKSISSPRLADLKKTQVELDLLADIDMLFKG